MVYGTYNELVTGAYKSTFTSLGGATLYQRLKFTNFAASQFVGSTMRYLIYCCWSLDSFYSHVPWHVLDLSPTVCLYLNPQWIPKKFQQTKNVCFVELKFTIFQLRKMSIRNPQKSHQFCFLSWRLPQGPSLELSEGGVGSWANTRLVTARGWYYPGWKWE